MNSIIEILTIFLITSSMLYPLIVKPNPLNFMINFLIYLLMILLMIYMNTNSPLLLMMIFITLIGGMMIIFNYFTSLVNIEEFKISGFEFFLLLISSSTSFFMVLTLWMITPSYFFTSELNLSLILNCPMKIYKIYLYPLNYISLLIMLLLLICLILIFKMSTSKFKSLRKMKN